MIEPSSLLSAVASSQVSVLPSLLCSPLFTQEPEPSFLNVHQIMSLSCSESSSSFHSHLKWKRLLLSPSSFTLLFLATLTCQFPELANLGLPSRPLDLLSSARNTLFASPQKSKSFSPIRTQPKCHLLREPLLGHPLSQRLLGTITIANILPS